MLAEREITISDEKQLVMYSSGLVGFRITYTLNVHCLPCNSHRELSPLLPLQHFGNAGRYSMLYLT